MATSSENVNFTVVKPPAAAPTAHPTNGANILAAMYPLKKRAVWLGIALVVGILIAGFWSARAVDGFGREVVAGNLVGDTKSVAGTFGDNGLGFGMLFAVAAGMAATFTACNCVVFAMIPGIACSTDRKASTNAVKRSLLWMVAGLLLVSASYGAFIGMLGPTGATAFNTREISRGMSRVVFTLLGGALIVWAMIEMGLLTRYTSKLSPVSRAFFAQSTVKAGVAGVMVGLFSVGRPFGPFHDFITFAASTSNPVAGAVLMSLQGLAMVAVMMALLLALVKFGGGRIARWVTTKPAQPALVTALALAVGGAYFVWYWGIANIPQLAGLALKGWGPKLGLY